MNNVFDKNYEKYDAWYDKHKFAFLSELKAIKKVLPRNGKGLEIGVGTGRFAEALGIADGIDPSPSMLALAQKRGIKVCSGFGEDMPFAAGTFDHVAMIITLCFVSDPLKVLNEAARVLKKDGKIIIGIVDKYSFLGRFYQKKKSVFYRQAKFMSVDDVTGNLKAAGFRVVSIYQTISILPDKMKAVEEPKEGFGRGGFVVISANKTVDGVSRESNADKKERA